MPIATPADISPVPEAEAPRDCALCPRLAAFREELRAEHPDWWNAPVPAFGDPDAWLGIVGLAPGKHGANRTGRPFTGDHAGHLLYETLIAHGLAAGDYDERIDDGLRLTGAVILNSVKCLPPQNKPRPEEVRACRTWFDAARAALPDLSVYVALGRIAHEAALRAFGLRLADHRFGHGAEHDLPGIGTLIDSYHCSRYNQNTGRLTPEMFDAVFARAVALSPSPRRG
ncbi:MAG: uracil-DNA glycosylase [Sphingomonadaceae bacterium]